MAYLPEQGVGFALMTNSDSHVALMEISRLVRDFITRDVARPVPPPPCPMPRLAARYAGWYRPDNPRVQHLYFFERLLGLAHVTVDGGALVVARLLGPPSRYVPVAGATFRGTRDPVATLALVDDSADGRPVAIERVGYMLPTSLVRVATPVVAAELALVALWVVGVLLTLLVAAVWLARLALRRSARSAATPEATVWLLPVGTTVSLLLIAALAVHAYRDGPVSMGAPRPATVGIYLLLWLFAALAIAGVAIALRPTPRVADTRWHALALWAGRAVSVLNLIAAAYLLYWGPIGWRMWA
jgi:hypothetical protein